ncbi:MAG: response regulator [Pseudomonadales bacterium]|nr:response regulator [Pseudomonadales bacterium]
MKHFEFSLLYILKAILVCSSVLLSIENLWALDATIDIASADLNDKTLLQKNIVVFEQENPEQELNAEDVWLSFQDWRQHAASDHQANIWRPLDQYPQKTYAVTTLWVGLHIENTGTEEAALIFENTEVTINDASVFIFTSGQLNTQANFGKKYRFSERLIEHRYFRLPLSVPAGEGVDLLLRFRIRGMNHIAIGASSLRSQQSYVLGMATAERIIWMYFGMMLLIVIMSAVTAYGTEDISFAYFSAFVLSVIFLHFVREGYALRYFWPDWPWMRYTGIAFAATSMFVSQLLFTRNFLDLKSNHPRVNIYILCTCLIILGLLFISLFVPVAYVYLLVISMAFIWLPALCCLLYCCIGLWYSGNEMARAYTIAWSVYLASLMINFLTSFFPTYGFSLGEWPSNIALFILSIFLFLVLIKRLRDNQLEHEKALAESAAKSDFLAKMSHEIRTPMNGVLGMAELLQDTKLDETQSYYARVIFNSGRTLLNVINEILDYSKIAAGKVELEDIEFDIFHMGQECISLFTVQAREKKLELICRIDPALPRIFKGDEGRIRQVIINLLGNAFKFTDSGEVMLNIEPVGESIRFQIQDSGIGITAEQQEKLFQDFTQADVSTSRKYGGTGLGLTISKQLVELMHGEIGIDSEYGIGTTFWFNLPLQRAVKQAMPAFDDSQLKGLKLLLVDDNESYRRVASELLRLLGIEISCAENGKQALEVLDKAEAMQQIFDLISVDLDMPVMNGMELIKQLAVREKRYPVVLLSATGFLPAPEEYKQYGVLSAAQKPILAEELKQLYTRVLGYKVQEESQSSTSEKENKVEQITSLNILVAEDNEVNFQVAAAMLRKMGHKVTHAVDGLDAITIYKAHNLNARETAFDLIFMDCEMPNMDGFEATQTIRKLESQRHLSPIHIIALTAHSDEQRINQCYSAGMNSYLSKPVQISDFRDKLAGLNKGLGK